MDNLKAEAKAGSAGYSPDGRCYSHVADFIDATGYGGIQKGGFNDAIPSAYWAEAHDFADYLNTGDNAAKLGLKNISSQVGGNPYNAPPGSIVVVAAGAPGTANPTAGDIAVKGDGDHFYNGGEMGYGGAAGFPTSKTLGIYVPTVCSGTPASEDPQDPPKPKSSSSCKTDTELIKQGEGYKLCMYHDSVGVKTICYGFNLETGSAPSKVAAVGGDFNSVNNGGCLSQSQCDSLLNTEI